MKNVKRENLVCISEPVSSENQNQALDFINHLLISYIVCNWRTQYEQKRFLVYEKLHFLYNYIKQHKTSKGKKRSLFLVHIAGMRLLSHSDCYQHKILYFPTYILPPPKFDLSFQPLLKIFHSETLCVPLKHCKSPSYNITGTHFGVFSLKFCPKGYF